MLAAFSTSTEMLIASRALLGVAGATLAPSTLSLIRNMFLDPKQRTFAIGVWARLIGILWLLFWAALVIGAVYLFRRRPPQRNPGESAATALAERYARGEIDEDEYRKRLGVLRERFP